MKDAQSPYELEVDTLNPRRAKTFSVLWEYLFNRKGPISTSGSYDSSHLVTQVLMGGGAGQHQTPQR